jgi:DNA-binding PadR family transcriptional regulator
MSATDLTELEGAALLVVRQLRTCTAYRIKREFGRSPSEFWSGSAGAVYPLVRRLVARGLLRESSDATDSRGTRALQLTGAGEDAALGWFGDVGRATSPGFDPLRTRLNFKPGVPAAAFEGLLGAVSERLEAQRDDPPAPPGENEEWAKAMAALWLESRLWWLQRAREAGLI